MRKGRCSNNPSACSFAASGKLLPFAGHGSLCPECGAPLAMVASESEDNEPFNTPSAPSRKIIEEDYEPAPNQALEFAKIAALIAVLGAGAFFCFKYLNQNKTDGVETTNSVISNSIAAPTIEEITPSQIARLAADTELKSAPDFTATSIAKFPAGAVFDVTGRTNVNGIDWVRVNIPNQAMVGYVEISKLMGIGGAPFILGNMAVEPVQVPVAPVISEITEIPETIYYVSSSQANLRAQAGANSEKVGAAVLGDTVSVTGSRTIDGKLWYRINLPNGGQGWVNGTLVSRTKPAPPPPEPDKTTIPEVKGAEITEGTYVVITSDKAKIVAEIGSETAIAADVQKGMAVQIQSVQEVDGKTWYQVRSKRFNIDGWVSSSSVKPVN